MEKFEKPDGIAYCFGISHEYPGTFILTYTGSSSLNHEYIGIYPKGFLFRERMFEEIDFIVKYFQSCTDLFDSVPSRTL